MFIIIRGPLVVKKIKIFSLSIYFLDNNKSRFCEICDKTKGEFCGIHSAVKDTHDNTIAVELF